MKILGSAKINKGFAAWLEANKKISPMMEEAGMSMIWAGTNADETKIFALMEVDDPQAAMAFGKREDIAKIRAEGGVDVESSEIISVISETHNWP
jgi:hypothetical protein